MIDMTTKYLLEGSLKINNQVRGEAVKFLTLLRGTSNSEQVSNFFDDYFLGLTQCLRMTSMTIKRLLLDGQDDSTLLRQWALMAKRAKDFYLSSECRLFHELFDSCFTKALFQTNESDISEPELVIRYLDLLNCLLSTSSNQQTRRYLVYCI